VVCPTQRASLRHRLERGWVRRRRPPSDPRDSPEQSWVPDCYKNLGCYFFCVLGPHGLLCQASNAHLSQPSYNAVQYAIRHVQTFCHTSSRQFYSSNWLLPPGHLLTNLRPRGLWCFDFLVRVDRHTAQSRLGHRSCYHGLAERQARSVDVHDHFGCGRDYIRSSDMGPRTVPSRPVPLLCLVRPVRGVLAFYMAGDHGTSLPEWRYWRVREC
jgi:hypothetical protein